MSNKVTNMDDFVRNIIRNSKKSCRENDDKIDEYLGRSRERVLLDKSDQLCTARIITAVLSGRIRGAKTQ